MGKLRHYSSAEISTLRRLAKDSELTPAQIRSLPELRADGLVSEGNQLTRDGVAVVGCARGMRNITAFDLPAEWAAAQAATTTPSA